MPKIINQFEPLTWQTDAWSDLSRVVLLTGSAGGGKSRIAAEKMHGFMQCYPGATGLIIRKTRDSMTNSTVIFMDRKIIGPDPRVVHKQQKNRWEYRNGSVLTYGGMKDEQQRQQVRSVGQDGGVDIVWIEEANALTEEDFNELQARMRGKAAPWRQTILTTNPDAPTHWIYKRLIQGGEAAVYYSGAQDNPNNPAEYIDALKSLTGIQGQRLRDGRWVQAEGAVYEDYDPGVHLIDSFAIPRDWTRYIAVDFGFTNPFVAQWWAEDYDGRLYLYREIYRTKRLVEDHAKRMKELSKDERINSIVCDHDAEGRATIERYFGKRTTTARKAINEGIQAVQARLRMAGDGKPRIFLLRNALIGRDELLFTAGKPVCTADEFPGYSWPKGQDGKAMKEVPIDEDNHGMDTTRYMTMHRDRVTANRFQRQTTFARV